MRLEVREEGVDFRKRHAEISVHVKDEPAPRPQHPAAHRVAFPALRAAVDRQKILLLPRGLGRYCQGAVGAVLDDDQDFKRPRESPEKIPQ